MTKPKERFVTFVKFYIPWHDFYYQYLAGLGYPRKEDINFTVNTYVDNEGLSIRQSIVLNTTYENTW